MQKKYFHRILLYLLTAATLSGCFDIIEVDQPTTINTNSLFTAKIKVNIQCIKEYKNTHFVFAYLVPREISGALNATVSYTSNVGNGTMYRIIDQGEPIDSSKTWSGFLLNKFGIQNNVLNDMVWIVYQTKEKYTVYEKDKDINATISLSYQLGNSNIIFRPSYIIANDVDGFGSSTLFNSDRVIIKNIQGNIKNYCLPQLVSIVPLNGNIKENLTITFNANACQNLLAKSNVVYLKSIAYTKNNKSIEIDNRKISSKLIPAGNNIWRISINPTKYYDLHEEKLDRLTFSFVNENNEVLDQDNFKRPFLYQY